MSESELESSRRPSSSMSSSRSSVFSWRSQGDCHHARLGEYAASLWKQDAMTDVLVVVQEREFKAHKAVLACYSPYFKEVLMKPGANEIHYLEIPCISPAAFEILLSFMYTGEMKVGCQDLSDVYGASRRLGMSDALDKCRELLTVSTRSIENAINLFVTSKKLDMLDSTARAFKLMLSYFDVLVKTNEFLQLTVDQITDYFSSDNISTGSEVNVYLAALRWLSHNFVEREAHIERVLGCVRFPQMSLSEITMCHHPPLLPGIVLYGFVHDLLYNATCYASAKHLGHEEFFSQLSCKPRTNLTNGKEFVPWDFKSLYDPRLYPEYRDNKAATKIQSAYKGYRARKQFTEQFRMSTGAATVIQSAFRRFSIRKSIDSGTESPKGSDWSIPSGTDLKKSPMGKEFTRNVIYAVGAPNEFERWTNSLLCFSPTSGNWKEVGNLPQARNNFKMTVLGNSIYCIGGCEPIADEMADIIPRKDCFRYDIDLGQWVTMAPLKVGRVFHGVAAIDDMIYAVGGKDHQNQIMSSVEMYNPKLNKWTDAVPMGSSRMGMGVTAFAGAIWVVGGMTGQGNKLTLVDTVECFDPKARRWIKKVQLPRPIAFTALVPCRNQLYSIGGTYQGSVGKAELTSTPDVYIYNSVNNVWASAVRLPNPWHCIVAASVDNNIYILGGQSSQNYAQLQEVFVYDPSFHKYKPAGPFPITPPGCFIAAAGIP